MNSARLRNRILTVAILPVILASTAVAYLVGSGRASDLEQAHQAQVGMLTQQLSIASQYGLYSGNRAYLDSMVTSLVSQPSVLGVVLFDARGQAMAGSGGVHRRSLEQVLNPALQKEAADDGRDLIVREIYASEVDLADLYTADSVATARTTQLLGYGVLDISRAELMAQTRLALAYSALVAAVVALLGALLALHLSRRVLHPVRLLLDNIRRIGAGDFQTAEPAPGDPLLQVHTQVALMAQRLDWRRQDLEQQIQAATDALRIQRDQAEKANRAKSHFLASASHDLRQPTHAIGLFVASLRQQPLQPQAELLVDYLQQSVHSMQDLLDGLLDLSRLDSGTVRVDAQAVPVEAVFATLRSATGPADMKPSVHLRVRPTRLWARTDPALLRQVLVNLVQNAIRYTDQGTVLVCCRPVRQGAALRIEVRDSGIGIEPQEQEVIFQEFYQVHNPGRDRGKGMGLGLSIVDRTVQLMGHTLELRSAPGCGSTFAIELPRCSPQEAPAAHMLAGEVPDHSGGGARILVLEDDPLVQSALCALLSSWSYQVDATSTHDEALASLQTRGVPDLFICDFRLGGVHSGLQVIQELRLRAGRHVPACLISGDTDADLIRQASEQEVPLLHKPIRPAKLRALLRRLITGPSQR